MAAVRRLEEPDRAPHFLEISSHRRAPCLKHRPHHPWDRNRGDDCDHHDHNQHFDERESAYGLLPGHEAVFPSRTGRVAANCPKIPLPRVSAPSHQFFVRRHRGYPDLSWTSQSGAVHPSVPADLQIRSVASVAPAPSPVHVVPGCRPSSLHCLRPPVSDTPYCSLTQKGCLTPELPLRPCQSPIPHPFPQVREHRLANLMALADQFACGCTC